MVATSRLFDSSMEHAAQRLLAAADESAPTTFAISIKTSGMIKSAYVTAYNFAKHLNGHLTASNVQSDLSEYAT